MIKQADVPEDVKKAIAFVWRTNEGFFENLFRVATYVIPFIPGLGWMVYVLDKFASMGFGMGFEDLGKWIDQQLGLSPGSEITEEHFMGLEPHFTKTLTPTTSMNHQGQFVKVAFLWGLLKSIGGVKPVLSKSWTIVKAVVGWLLLTFGASSMNQLYQNIDQYKALAKQKATELAKDAIQQQLLGGGNTIEDLTQMLS